MAEFLLIHGSCHGAWCWHRVIPALEGLGHTARAIDLPGHGDDPTPVTEITAEAYRDAILSAIDTPVILVGHSMAGFPISDVAEAAPDKVARLVYVCAYLPRDGVSLIDMRKEAPRQLLRSVIEISGDGLSWDVAPENRVPTFYHDCPEEDVALAQARLRPQAIKPQATPIRLGANFARVPKSYIRCTDDRTIPPEHQAEMSQGAGPGNAYDLATSHSPFFANPEALADILDRIARG